MKNTYIKLLALLFIASASVSCVNDDETFGINANKPTATTTVTSLTIAEGESDVIPFTLSRAINKPSQFKIELVGGNGNQEDITAGDGDTDADTGIPHVGFEITVPAYTSSFDIPVNAILDLDQTENNETIMLKITAAGNRTVVTPVEYIVNLTIVDYKFCLWTLDATDTYGDGWNNAVIRVTADGEVTDYANSDPDGVIGPETESFSIGIEVGANYSFEFVSGDWDGEIEYVLTAPDGTVFADAYYPAVGVITSGVSSCN